MQTISVLSRKGGVGKSTLAVHLAVLANSAGRSALIDLDPQHSAGDWWRARDAGEPILVETVAGDLPAVVDAARDEGLGWLIIDTPPHADLEPVAAARAADLVLIVTRPGILDLRAIGATVDLVKATGARAVIVLNHCPPGRGDAESGLTTEAREGLKAYGLPICPISITQRVDFSHALITGHGVTEFAPIGKAAAEIEGLWKWIKKALR